MQVWAKLQELWANLRELWVELWDFKMRRLLKENEWEGLIPGDVVEYKGRKLMYLCLDMSGGPGNPRIPEYAFGPIHPKDPKRRYYVRLASEIFPEEIFGEDVPPVEMGSTGMFIGFLNATRGNFRVVDHITPKQWQAMLAD